MSFTIFSQLVLKKSPEILIKCDTISRNRILEFCSKKVDTVYVIKIIKDKVSFPSLENIQNKCDWLCNST